MVFVSNNNNYCKFLLTIMVRSGLELLKIQGNQDCMLDAEIWSQCFNSVPPSLLFLVACRFYVPSVVLLWLHSSMFWNCFDISLGKKVSTHHPKVLKFVEIPVSQKYSIEFWRFQHNLHWNQSLDKYKFFLHGTLFQQNTRISKPDCTLKISKISILSYNK